MEEDVVNSLNKALESRHTGIAKGIKIYLDSIRIDVIPAYITFQGVPKNTLDISVLMYHAYGFPIYCDDLEVRIRSNHGTDVSYRSSMTKDGKLYRADFKEVEPFLEYALSISKTGQADIN